MAWQRVVAPRGLPWPAARTTLPMYSDIELFFFFRALLILVLVFPHKVYVFFLGSLLSKYFLFFSLRGKVGDFCELCCA